MKIVKNEMDELLKALYRKTSILRKTGKLKILFQQSNNSVDWTEWKEIPTGMDVVPDGRYVRVKFLDEKGEEVYRDIIDYGVI